MRVIFLDVDGVLNHQKAFEEQQGNGVYVLCPKAVANLRFLVAHSGAKIVLSSTWRKHPGLVRYLEKHGVLDEQHDDGKTPDYVKIVDPVPLPVAGVYDEKWEKEAIVANWRYGCRGDEIAHWLKRHMEVTQYIILDDDGDMLDEQKPFFVQTDFRGGGLTEEKTNAALALFDAMGPDRAA